MKRGILSNEVIEARLDAATKQKVKITLIIIVVITLLASVFILLHLPWIIFGIIIGIFFGFLLGIIFINKFTVEKQSGIFGTIIGMTLQEFIVSINNTDSVAAINTLAKFVSNTVKSIVQAIPGGAERTSFPEAPLICGIWSVLLVILLMFLVNAIFTESD